MIITFSNYKCFQKNKQTSTLYHFNRLDFFFLIWLAFKSKGAFQAAGNTASQWYFPDVEGLYWAIHEYLVSHSLPIYPPVCSFALEWVFSIVAAAVPQCQTLETDTQHLLSSSTFSLSYSNLYFLTFFSPLTSCCWSYWTFVLICILCYLKPHAQEASGCSVDIWGILPTDYLCFILLHSGMKPQKSHLTNPSSANPDLKSGERWVKQAIPAVSTCSNWLSWGRGHLSGLFLCSSRSFKIHIP